MPALGCIFSFLVLVVLFFLIPLEQTLLVGASGVLTMLLVYGSRLRPSVGAIATSVIAVIAVAYFYFTHLGWRAGAGFLMLILSFSAFAVLPRKQKSVTEKNQAKPH